MRQKKALLQFATMIKVLAVTGMRRSELCGLFWDDIDFDNKVINIRRSLLYVAKDGKVLGRTKTYQHSSADIGA